MCYDQKVRILAFDVGKRHTGCAFIDAANEIPLPQNTIHHESVDDLLGVITSLVMEKKVDRVVLGLPLLPSGTEGEQAAFVREIFSALTAKNLSVLLVDERYSTPRSPLGDGDAQSACDLAIAGLKLTVDKL